MTNRDNVSQKIKHPSSQDDFLNTVLHCLILYSSRGSQDDDYRIAKRRKQLWYFCLVLEEKLDSFTLTGQMKQFKKEKSVFGGGTHSSLECNV